MTGNLSAGISAIATNDYIFVEGDPSAKVAGLDAWVPATAPSSAAFFNVDRTSDVTRLGGVRFSGIGMSIEEALIGGAARTAREGANIDHAFMNFETFAALEKSLGSKVVYIDVKEPVTGINFNALRLQGPNGFVKVIPDQNCQSNVIWLLQLDTWKMGSLGKAPKILDSDGLKMLRETSADNVEIRIGYYGNVMCNAPGWNCRVALA